MFNPLVYYTINKFFCTGKGGGLYRKRGGVQENGRRCTGKKRGIVQEREGLYKKRGRSLYRKRRGGGVQEKKGE